MDKKYRIETLPKWAQKIIKDQIADITKLKQLLNTEKQCNQITSEMDWYTLGIHAKESRGLFIIDKDAPRKIAIMGKDSVVLVGTPIKKVEGK